MANPSSPTGCRIAAVRTTRGTINHSTAVTPRRCPEQQTVRILPMTVLPEKDDHILIQFNNDIGTFQAAGIACETVDTKEIVFADVLAGHIYDWNTLVIMWAKL